MEKKIIKLTEADLHQIVEDAVQSIIKENNEDEGFFNNLKTGVNTFMNNKGIGDRFRDAKANYKTQGELDNISGLISQLTQLLRTRKISPDTTVAQLVGGEFNNNKFGTMSGMMNNRKQQLRNRGYKGSF